MNTIQKVSYNNQILFRRGLAYEKILNRISCDTELIGISVPFTNLASLAKELCRLIKEKYHKIPIVAGGVHVSAFPQDMLKNGIDYAVKGEGEIPMLEIASKKNPRHIKGIVYIENDELIDNGTVNQVEDLDQLPFPFDPDVLIEQYLSYSPRGQTRRRSLSMITSRGCPYDCFFCSVHPVSGYRWRFRSPENVIAEIRYYIEKYNVNHIEFEDDNLTLDTRRAEDIFDKIISLKKDITWAVNNGLRVDTLNLRLIKKMKKSGCIQLNLAIESGNKKILHIMQKKLSLEKVEEVVSICRRLRILTLGFFLVGYPGETKETFLETVKYIKKLKKKGLNRIGAMIVNAYPGTKLYNYCRERGYLDKDVDNHIFVDDDYVSIITKDFDRGLVLYWREFLYGLFHPLRWQIKKITRTILPKKVFEKLIYIYRYRKLPYAGD